MFFNFCYVSSHIQCKKMVQMSFHSIKKVKWCESCSTDCQICSSDTIRVYICRQTDVQMWMPSIVDKSKVAWSSCLLTFRLGPNLFRWMAYLIITYVKRFYVKKIYIKSIFKLNFLVFEYITEETLQMCKTTFRSC